jgi:hypothetical protein
MHEVCALLYLALNQEALAWSTATPSSEWKDLEDKTVAPTGKGSGAPRRTGPAATGVGPGRSTWADFMIHRAQLKKTDLLAKIEKSEREGISASLLQNELRYALCEESEVFAIFDRVMTRGLRVVYCSEVTDSLPSEEDDQGMSSEGGSTSSGGMGYLNLIQDLLLKKLHPVLWEHLQSSMIQPQLYAISWARLLFGRVYVVTADLLFLLWDYLFESTDHWKARASSASSSSRDQLTSARDDEGNGNGSDDDSEAETERAQKRLEKLTGYDIRDPLLLKLACFILALVLEVSLPFSHPSPSLSLSLSLPLSLPLSLSSPSLSHSPVLFFVTFASAVLFHVTSLL